MNAIFKTGKKILNALAFANAGNMSEFNELLHEMEPQNTPRADRARLKLVSVNAERPDMTAPAAGAGQTV
jgi:hypothetical protein